MSESNAPLLELTGNRTIVLYDRNRIFTLSCRRVMPADWLAYFASIVVTSEQNGRERINVMDFDTPRKSLAESVLVDATGYSVEGGKSLTEIPHWQTRIPLSHRLELGRVLADVRPSQGQGDFVIYAEGELVLIDATWASRPVRNEIGDSIAMQRFLGLKHILKTPTEAQHKRYAQQASRSVIVGGSRNGRTIYGGTQEVLCKLYDELVIAVEGYSFNGEPLSDVAIIKREMDLQHKFIAAQELFAPQANVSTSEAKLD